jgi:hypothetical protein
MWSKPFVASLSSQRRFYVKTVPPKLLALELMIAEATQTLRLNGIPEPEKESEILMASVLGISRAELLYRTMVPLNSQETTGAVKNEEDLLTGEFKQYVSST